MSRARNPKGDGCYDKCGDYYRWRLGVFDPTTNKTRYVTLKAKSRPALSAKVNEWKEKYQAGEEAPIAEKRWTVKDWVEYWLKEVKYQCADHTTYRHYKLNAYKHIVPNFGNLLLTKVSSVDLQSYFYELLEDHKPSTVAEIRSVFRNCFSLACRHELIPKNPVLMTKPPRRGKPELKILETDEVARLLQAAKEGSYIKRHDPDVRDYIIVRNYLVVLLGASTGMRIGEVLALRWSCVNGNEIRVDRSLQEINRQRTLKSTKTGRERIVAVPVSVANKLEEFRKQQERYAEKFKGIFQNELSLIFTALDGRPMSRWNFVNREYKKMCEIAGIEPKPRFHDLRHYAASSALMNKVPITAVAEQLGHSSTDTTHRRYLHVLQQSRDELHNILDSDPLFQ